MKSESVTYRFGKIVDEIKTPIKITNPLNGESTITFALWDTGATDCAITESLVKRLNLPIFSKAKVIGVHGIKQVNVHFIEFKLDNENIKLKTQVTSCSELSEDGTIGFLIGMNLITQGDLVLSNYSNETVMSFRIPSKEILDFNISL